MSIDTTARNGDAHTRADLARLAFGVRGMTCASGVSHVESALTRVKGVTEASVNLATERAAVELTPDTNAATIAKAVEDAGYEPAVETIELGVDGMSCASCVAHVEKALRADPVSWRRMSISPPRGRRFARSLVRSCWTICAAP